MTTPPQGPWGPGQGGQPGQGGGWGQQPGPQPGQGGGWGQQPGQQPEQGGGWGQQPGQQPGQPGPGGYQQEGWQTQQPPSPWQPGQQRPPRGGRNDKMPLIVGGGVVGVLLIALLVFLGVRALGDDNTEPTTQPTQSQPTGQPTGDPTGNPTGDPTAQPSQGVGNSTGQAKAATDKLATAGYLCSDLFNGPQGAHRGCFEYAETTKAEALFQFSSDGTIIGVSLRSYDSDNVNKAASAFDEILNAIGGAAFAGDVPKVQTAVKGGQKDTKVGTSWGEFNLGNSGDTLRLSGRKSGADRLELPRKTFETSEAQLKAALQAKGYNCAVLCRKQVGQSGSQYIAGIGLDGGIRILTASVSGDATPAKSAFPGLVADAFGAVKGQDVAVLQAWVKEHQDGKSHTSYVNGWRIDLDTAGSETYLRQELKISYESSFNV